MEEFKRALEIRKRYNAMPFDDFVAQLETYLGYKIPQEEKENFRFTGLMNQDFFMMHVKIK